MGCYHFFFFIFWLSLVVAYPTIFFWLALIRYWTQRIQFPYSNLHYFPSYHNQAWGKPRKQINMSFNAFHASIHRNEMRINCANDINHRYTQKPFQWKSNPTKMLFVLAILCTVCACVVHICLLEVRFQSANCIENFRLQLFIHNDSFRPSYTIGESKWLRREQFSPRQLSWAMWIKKIRTKSMCKLKLGIFGGLLRWYWVSELMTYK